MASLLREEDVRHLLARATLLAAVVRHQARQVLSAARPGGLPAGAAGRDLAHSREEERGKAVERERERGTSEGTETRAGEAGGERILLYFFWKERKRDILKKTNRFKSHTAVDC